MTAVQASQLEHALRALADDLSLVPAGDCPRWIEARLHQLFALGRPQLRDALPAHQDGDLIALVDHLWSPLDRLVARFLVGQTLAALSDQQRYPWAELGSAHQVLAAEPPAGLCDETVRAYVAALVDDAAALLVRDPLLVRLRNHDGREQLTIVEVAALANQALAAQRAAVGANEATMADAEELSR